MKKEVLTDVVVSESGHTVEIDKEWYEENLRRLRRGWKLHLWRGSSPWNYYLQSPSGKQIYLSGNTGVALRTKCTLESDSEARLPDLRILRHERNLPESSIFAYRKTVKRAA